MYVIFARHTRSVPSCPCILHTPLATLRILSMQYYAMLCTVRTVHICSRVECTVDLFTHAFIQVYNLIHYCNMAGE